MLINGRGRHRNFGINAVPGLYTPVSQFRKNGNNTLHLSIFNMSYMKVLFEKQIRIRIIAKKVMGASVN